MIPPELVPGPEGIEGLSSDEASRILKEDGPNELPSGRRHTILDTVFEVMKEPMFLLLLAAGSLYLVLGDHGEALMLLAFVLFVIGITVFQERRVEHALDALRDLSSPGRWSSATASPGAYPAGTWCAGTSSCSSRATGCPPTASSSRTIIFSWMSPCLPASRCPCGRLPAGQIRRWVGRAATARPSSSPARWWSVDMASPS